MYWKGLKVTSLPIKATSGLSFFGRPFLFFVPEEFFALAEFFFFGFGGVDGFEGVGVDAGVIDFGGQGHGGRSEILDLFEFEVQAAGFGSQVGHVFVGATGMGGNKVGDQLLLAAFFGFEAFVFDFFKNVVEGFELFEVGFAHQVEDFGVCVLGSDF